MESYSDSSSEISEGEGHSPFFLRGFKINPRPGSPPASTYSFPLPYALRDHHPSSLRRLVAKISDIVAFVCKIFCMYMFVVVFVTSIAFTLNTVLQILFSAFTFRRAVTDNLSFSLIIVSLSAFGLYSIMIFPVLIYELYKFAADAWSFEGQFRELGNRFLYTRIPQMIFYRWYGLDRSLFTTVEATQWRRHTLVRTLVILPSAVAAAFIAAFYSGDGGGLSLFPSWFLCISFLISLGLALVFVAIGYIKVLWEESEYYLWLRMTWKKAGANQEASRFFVLSRMLIRTGVLIMAVLTPLSLHLVIWRYYIKRLPLTKEEDFDDSAVIVLNSEKERLPERSSKLKTLFTSVGRGIWICMWLLVPLSVMSVVVFFTEVSISAGVHIFVFYMVTFPMLALAAHKIWIPKKGVLWPLFLFLLLLSLAILGASLLMVAVLDSSNHHVQTPVFAINTSLPIMKPVTQLNGIGYQICNSKWYTMDIIDFGLLSWLAYYDPNTEAWNDKLARWFDPTDWQLKKVSGPRNLITYFDMFSQSKNVSVVSVRGTATVLDGFEDLSLWSEALQLQVVSTVFPVVFTWPEASTSTLVHIMAYVSRVLFPPDSEFAYFTEIDNYVMQVKSSREVILTGHSLGGSIATVIGAKRQVPAIAFCSPGTIYSRKKFGIDLDNIHKYSVSVKPSGDLISSIDSTGGSIQWVMCDAALSFPECHFLETVMCPMIQSGCGSRVVPPLNC